MTYRPPLWYRLYYAAGTVVAIVLLVVIITQGSADPPILFFWSAVTAVCVVYCWRTATLRVSTRDASLEVRGWFTTRRIPRGQIDDFVVGRGRGWAWLSPVVYAIGVDGARIPLYGVTFPLSGLLGWLISQPHEQADRLREWLRRTDPTL